MGPCLASAIPASFVAVIAPSSTIGRSCFVSFDSNVEMGPFHQVRHPSDHHPFLQLPFVVLVPFPAVAVGLRCLHLKAAVIIHSFIALINLYFSKFIIIS